MKLEQQFSNLKSFVELERFLQNAKPETTFWGIRNVAFSHHDGAIRVYDVMEKLMSIWESNTKFNEEDRKIGKRIFKKISTLDEETLLLIKNSNFFTRLFNVLNQIFGGDPDTLFLTMDFEKIFESYTNYQFERVFGINMADAEEGKNLGGSLLRYVLKHNVRRIEMWELGEGFQERLAKVKDKDFKISSVREIVCEPPQIITYADGRVVYNY